MVEKAIFMDKRKWLILHTIIKEHIKTGTPVGSGVLVDKYKLNVSSATVRNVMADLENDGYIVQPHTSAGRVPTEKAYRRYLENLGGRKLGQAEEYNLNSALRGGDEADFKEAAKIISQISGNTVFWAFHRRNLYYTGISNLFQQPEFREYDLLYNMSVVIDRFDEIIDEIFDSTKEGISTLIGSDNPFGHFCGTVLAKYRLGGQTGLFGILGPMRMNYEKNIALVKFVSERLED